MGIQLGGPDIVSIKLLTEWPDGLCLSPLIVNPSQELTDLLVQQYFENGAALFGRESTCEIEMVREVVGGAFANLDVKEIARIVQYYVQRTRNYGHIGRLWQAGINAARVVDSGPRMPSSCIGHDGRIVSIEYAAGRIDWFQTLTHEQYGYGVFDKDYGFPPFDLECTCRLEGVIAGVDYPSKDGPQALS